MPPYRIYSSRRPCTRSFASQIQTDINKQITNKLTDGSIDIDKNRLYSSSSFSFSSSSSSSSSYYYYYPHSLLHNSSADFQNSTVLTHQAFHIHCSPKNVLTIWHIISITAFCVGMYRPGRRLNNFILSCNLFGIVTVVGSTAGIAETVFICHFLISSSFRSVYFRSFSVMVLLRLRLLGIAAFIKFAFCFSCQV